MLIHPSMPRYLLSYVIPRICPRPGGVCSTRSGPVIARGRPSQELCSHQVFTDKKGPRYCYFLGWPQVDSGRCWTASKDA